MYRAIVKGIGSYVPDKRLNNLELEGMVDTSDEWIKARTGISERRIAQPSEATSDFALNASIAAIQDAGIDAHAIDLIIVATSTADHIFPSVACQLQVKLGCGSIGAFDVNAACSGFISALQIAEQFLKNGKVNHVLVVGADTMSRITDYTDRSTCILFSDGAGAFVVSKSEDEETKGIIYSSTHSDGEYLDSLYVQGGGSRISETETCDKASKPKIVMEGNKIFKLAVNKMAKTVKETLKATGYEKDEIDWVIPHQANHRIIDAVATQLQFPTDKMINTIKNFGNNSAASIPLAMDIAVKDGRVKRGDTLILTAFGGGLVWGSILLEY
jgi:3-oxoacyl-[acyl-carrier-protein] synthase-3